MVTENIVHELADAQSVSQSVGDNSDFLMDFTGDVYALSCFDFRRLQESRNRLAALSLSGNITGLSQTFVGCTLRCTGNVSLTLSCLQAVRLTVIHLSSHVVID